MYTPFQQILAVLLVITVSMTVLLYPVPVEARGFFKNLLRFVNKITRFIVTAPGKIASALTRPLGPVLGPIAAELLLSNTPNRIMEIVNKASKVQGAVKIIEDQNRKIKAAKKVLQDRADEMYEDLEELYDLDAEMKKQLLSGDISYDEYKKDFIALNKIIEAYEDTAGRIEQAAQNMKPENLLKQIAGDAINASKRKVQRILRHNVTQELQKIFNEKVINSFLGEGGKNVVWVIDKIVEGDAYRILRDQGYDTDHANFRELLERVKAEIKDQLKKDKDYLKDNWRTVMEEKIKEILAEYETANKEGTLDSFFEKYGNTNQSSANDEKAVNASAPIDESEFGLDELLEFEDPEDHFPPSKQLPTDEDGCYPGYEWSVKVGDCIQTNCNSITDAHWSYTLDCVCGSSGSIEENPNDPNKECYLMSTDASCPSCVYACVGLKAECPDRPSK